MSPDSLLLRAIGKPAGCKLLRIEIELEGLQKGRPLPERGSMVFPGAPPSGYPRDGLGREECIIRRILVRGDFFALPEEGFEAIEAALAGSPLSSLASRFEELAAALGVELIGITGAAVAQLVEEAIHGASIPTA